MTPPPPTRRRILLSSPDVGQREEQLVVEAVRSGWIAPLGPMVDAFEHAIAQRCGRRHAVALSSGTRREPRRDRFRRMPHRAGNPPWCRLGRPPGVDVTGADAVMGAAACVPRDLAASLTI
jgi:hypothetical protein